MIETLWPAAPNRLRAFSHIGDHEAEAVMTAGMTGADASVHYRKLSYSYALASTDQDKDVLY